jgi:hypothetical protein
METQEIQNKLWELKREIIELKSQGFKVDLYGGSPNHRANEKQKLSIKIKALANAYSVLELELEQAKKLEIVKKDSELEDLKAKGYTVFVDTSFDWKNIKFGE